MGWLEVTKLSGSAGNVGTAVPAVDVVFVHGLGSNAKDAWTCADNKHYWPQALADSDPQVQVWTVGYPADAVEWFGDGSNQPDLERISLESLLSLNDAGLGRRPAVWVAHSLGGLLTKLILLKSDERQAASAYEFRHDSVVGLLFLATPHGGASLANVLSFSLKTAKPLLGQALVSAIGLPGLAGWLAEKGLSRACNSTELIDYLKRGDDTRDTDRHRFNTYFGSRHRSQRPLEVRAFRETEAKKVAGVPSVIVVDGASADPKVFYEHTTPVLVQDAVGRDHSTICKPQDLSDPVAQVLKAMVDRARRREFVFELGDPEHDRVAGQAFRYFTGSVELLGWLSSSQEGEKRELAAQRARQLVGGTAAAAAAGLETLVKCLKGGLGRLLHDDLDAVRDLGGELAVLAYGAFASSLSDQAIATGASAFVLPDLGTSEDPELRTYYEIITEILQAHHGHRLARFALEHADGTPPEPVGASPRVIANAVSDPASMRIEDHVNDLHMHIRYLALVPDIRCLPLRPSGQGVAGRSAITQRLLRAEAAEHLRALDSRRQGLWVDARAPGNAYRQASLREAVHAEFGSLLPFALQSDVLQEYTDEQVHMLSRMRAQVSHFAIALEQARRRLNST